MRKRVISGLTGALLVILILFFNQTHPAVLNIAAAIISVLAIHEVFCVVGNPAQWLITIPTTIFVACVPLFSCSLSWSAIWYIYSIWMFSLMLIKPDIKFISIAKIYTMAILIAASFGYMISLRDLGESNGSFFVLLGLCIAWMSDTGAYFCGKIFGKNKLYPEISPKKTIEGFFGGIIVCVISVLVTVLGFNALGGEFKINYFLLIIISIIGSLISVLGDLCFSAVKRRCKVKDFGDVMPGHGGILDRFDSVIFVIPYTYMVLKFILN